MPEPDDNAPDVLPPLIRDLLILAWLLLFGGRWLLFPVLQALGALKPEQVATWDEAILLKLYLVLLAATILVVVLRAVRAAQRPAVPDAPVAPHSDTSSLDAAETSARGENARD